MKQPKKYFVITSDDVIYKRHKDGWLRMSPPINDAPRFVTDVSGQKMPSKDAICKYNAQWREYTPRWTYQGKQYEARQLEPGILRQMPMHHSDNIHDAHHLVMVNGKLKWLCADNMYYPNAILYDMNNGMDKPKCTITKRPDGGVRIDCHSSWCQYHNLKYVYCITDNKIV